MSFNYDQQLLRGRVCLHPAGALWGLTALGTEAPRQLNAIKQRSLSQSFIYLIPSWPLTEQLWQPLPGDPAHPHHWATLLKTIWPAALSVIWKTNPHSPLIATIGAHQHHDIALRLDDHKAAPWFSAALIRMGLPLPTTSINQTSHSPLYQKNDIIQFAQQHQIFIPAEFYNHNFIHSTSPPLPSTIIRIQSSTTYQLLRGGAIPQSQLNTWLPSKRCLDV